jgi:hypothetical protein
MGRRQGEHEKPGTHLMVSHEVQVSSPLTLATRYSNMRRLIEVRNMKDDDSRGRQEDSYVNFGHHIIRIPMHVEVAPPTSALSPRPMRTTSPPLCRNDPHLLPNFKPFCVSSSSFHVR